MGDLSRLLRPRSLAVVGGVWAENVIRACERDGFEGDIWPVHPTKAEIAGRRAFASVADLPGAPDAAFVAVNRHASVEVMAALAQAGAGGAIAFASGFAETGEAELQRALVDAAGDMPVLGPNCYGVINALDGASIWPDQHGCRRVGRGVAVLSQSSNIAMTLTMQRRGLPVAMVACVGNAAQTSLADLAHALLSEPRVTALGIYMEGVGDAARFAEIAEFARELGKGIVVLKAGRSAGGAAAAVTHTGALTGEAAVSSAFFAQAGVGEATGLPDLIETLKVLHVHGPLKARRFVSVSCSGGEAGLMADAADGGALEFPPLPRATEAALAETLGPLVRLSNPLDYQTFIWHDRTALACVFTAALDGYDAGFFVIDPPRADTCDPSGFDPALSAITEAAQSTGKPAFAIATLAESFDEMTSERLMADGVVPLAGIDHGLSAVEAAIRRDAKGWRPLPAQDGGTGTILDEAAGKALLRRSGLQVPNGVTARSIGALEPVGLSAPFALKGLGLAHKTEAAAVRLGVSDPYAEAPMEGVSGYLLEEMVDGALAELLVGVRRDPVYGATLTLGIGGTEAEVLADSVALVLPVNDADIHAALRRLRLWPLLDGYRGRPRPDVNAAVSAIGRLADLLAEDTSLIEIEVNPLILTVSRAVAADVLVRRLI